MPPFLPLTHPQPAGKLGEMALASIARSGLRRVAHDLGLGVMQVVITSKLGIATVLQADRVVLMADARARRIGGRFALVAAAPASRFFALAGLHRRLEIVEQFPRTTVQEVPV